LKEIEEEEEEADEGEVDAAFGDGVEDGNERRGRGEESEKDEKAGGS
jgi:hypothetical protein